jgi:cytochrome o ubiquinol oxidase operon protein cyoD
MQQEPTASLEPAHDKAPGIDEDAPPESVLSYTAGLGFALLLTGASFFVARSHLIWGPGVPVGLAVLAIAQMGVHLVFFLQLSTGPDNTNNVLALAFGVLIVTLVVSGSLWIMAHLNANMMPPAAIMEMR